MKITKYDGSRLRSVLIAMIVNDKVLATIATRWPREGLFGSPSANLIGGWCVAHFNRFQKAPGRAIKNTFMESGGKTRGQGSTKPSD